MSAARPDTWMPWHIAKYLADTMHLTTEQHGAYLLLLAAGWMRGGELSDDNGQLAAIARLPLKRWLAMRDTISAFYTISAGAWRQKRQIEELEKAIALTNARSEAGKRGGRPKANDKQTESPALANGQANEKQGQTPITLTVTSKEEIKDSVDQILKALGGKRPNSTPQANWDDPANRKARWQQKMQAELFNRLPKANAEAIWAGYVAGDSKAVAFIETVDKSVKQRRASVQ